jgi:hypothetical protein
MEIRDNQKRRDTVLTSTSRLFVHKTGSGHFYCPGHEGLQIDASRLLLALVYTHSLIQNDFVHRKVLHACCRLSYIPAADCPTACPIPMEKSS